MGHFVKCQGISSDPIQLFSYTPFSKISTKFSIFKGSLDGIMDLHLIPSSKLS